ncbi:hypothetical protein EV424DRAFT_1439409 [Suillus variegatus]|nr:hypothetical protein EV424DRAFT_1439409 [Suillus variegatus]
MHLNIERTTVNASSICDVIGTLQNILAHSRVIIPDLETPYSLFPNIDHSAIGRGDKSISAIITERQQQLDTVVQEISGLESVMDRMKNIHQQLLKKKDEIIQSMNLHRGLLSALWRLPPEILSLIFVRCLPETEHLLPSPTLAPVLLTRICRRWRDVAIGMSSLWCGALIVDNSHKEWQRAASCYNTWFERSRDLPLSLVLKCFKNYTTHLRSLLEPRMSKISNLPITTSDPLWCTPSFAQSISRLPSTLRRLRVAGPSAFDFDRITSCNPVWAHLTHIEIAICPNLSSLEIGLGFYDEVPLTFEPFMHANLQFFRISNASPMRMGNLFPDLFNALTLPNLRILEARYIRPWPHEELKTFLARSSCPLESLIFGTGVTMTDEQRGEYIVLVPFLDVVVDHRRSGYFGYRRLR